MGRPQVETPGLDEQVWRAWVHKGRLRDQAQTRRWRIIGGTVIVMIAIISAIYALLQRN